MGRFSSRRRNARQPFDGAATDDGDEIEPAIVERETQEFLTSALQDSDTATEIIQDSAEDSTHPGARRLALGLIGLALSASGLLAARSVRARRRRKRKLSRVRAATELASRLLRR
jgi:hypothetical protein